MKSLYSSDLVWQNVTDAIGSETDAAATQHKYTAAGVLIDSSPRYWVTLGIVPTPTNSRDAGMSVHASAKRNELFMFYIGLGTNNI